jgi:spore maturation protein CgeB
MNIAFFGSSLLSAYWNGAATYYRGLVRSLAELGHQITFYEPDAFGRQQNRDLDPPSWAKVVVYSSETSVELRSCLKEASRADVLVKASGVGVFDEYLEARIPSVGAGKITIFWDVDAPATLDRVLKNHSDPFRRAIPSYTAVLTYGGGQRVIDTYQELGARFCVPVYNAADPTTHFRVDEHPAYRADLAFLGNRLPDREQRVEEFFLRAASLRPQNSFLLGGSGWEDKPKTDNVRYIGHVPTGEHNAVNSTARLVLNINRLSMATYGFSPPTRIFEAAAAGACIVTDAWEGIDMFLQPGREILIVNDGREVANVLDSLDQERARQIGDAAQRRILNEHTYLQRAKQVDALLRALPAIQTNVVEVHS